MLRHLFDWRYPNLSTADNVSNFVMKLLRLLRLPMQFDVDTTFGVCRLLQRVSTMHTKDWHLCVQLVLFELSRARFVGFSAESAPRMYVCVLEQ
jgi:hypothetical protein